MRVGTGLQRGGDKDWVPAGTVLPLSFGGSLKSYLVGQKPSLAAPQWAGPASIAPFGNALRTGGLSRLVTPRLAGGSEEWGPPRGRRLRESGPLVDPALTSTKLFLKPARERGYF